MDTALPQKFLFILDRNLAKANYTENRVYTSCDTVVLGYDQIYCKDIHTYIEGVSVFHVHILPHMDA